MNFLIPSWRWKPAVKFFISMTFLRWPKSVKAISIWLTAISIQFDSRQFQFTHGNFNSIWLMAMSIYWRQRSRHFSLRSPPVNYSGRLGRTQTGMSLFRSPYIPDPSYFRTGLKPYRSNVKQNNESQTGSISSMFLRLAPPLLLFLSKNRNTVTNNNQYTSLRSSFNAWINVRDCTILRCCAVNINRPPGEC